MRIALVNQCTDARVTSAYLTSLAQVLDYQLANHYVKMWQGGAVPVFFAADSSQIAEDVCPLVFRDKSDVEGALGDHYTASGRPVGEVLVKVIMDNGGDIMQGPNSLPCTASHEALEMVGDPYAKWWSDLSDGVTEEAIELSDRTEADCYKIGDFSVSNFLGPRAFSNGPGLFDYLGLLHSAEEIRPGGYAIHRQGGPGGKISTPWGHGYPDWKKELKMRDFSRLGRRVKGLSNGLAVFK